MCWNGDGKIVEGVGRRGQEVNRSIALPLCLMSYIVLHRRSESHKEGRHWQGLCGITLTML
jgi:hypothetical protein